MREVRTLAFTIATWLLAVSFPVEARPMAPFLDGLRSETIATGPPLRDLVEREALRDDLVIDAREVEETTSWLAARELAPLGVTLEGPPEGRARRGRRLLLEWTRAGLGSARWNSARQEIESLVAGDGWTDDSREQMEVLLDAARKVDGRIHARDPYTVWAIQLSRGGRQNVSGPSRR